VNELLKRLKEKAIFVAVSGRCKNNTNKAPARPSSAAGNHLSLKKNDKLGKKHHSVVGFWHVLAYNRIEEKCPEWQKNSME